MSLWQTKDSDPDPCQNVPDPEDWLLHCAAAARQNLYNLKIHFYQYPGSMETDHLYISEILFKLI
jgi:hypothetical protein